jgi:hypothetical protein
MRVDPGAWLTFAAACAPGAVDVAPVAPECAGSPPLLAISIGEDPPSELQRAIEVTADPPAPVAVRCSAGYDVHLVESPTAGSHEIRFSGLLSDTTYQCEAVSTCPAGDPVALEVATGRGPSSLPDQLDVDVDPQLGATGAWTLLNHLSQGGCGEERHLAIYDIEGRLRWAWEVPRFVGIDTAAEWDPALGQIVWGGGYSSNGRPSFTDLWEGLTFQADFPDWENTVFHHDAKRLADGRLISLEDRLDAAPPLSFAGFAVRVLDPTTGAVTWDFESQALVDSGSLPVGSGDPWHANWVGWSDGADGGERLYVSLCAAHQVLAIDVPGGTVAWKFGVGGDFALQDPDGAPLPDDDFPQCQHGIEVDGDELLVYDNGQTRGESRAEIFSLDPTKGVATREWVWTEPGWFEDTLGDIDRLGEDRILVVEAHPECWAPARRRTSIVEVVQSTGAVAARTTFPDRDDAIYRAQRLGGCDVFANTRFCPALAARAAALAPLFDR